MDDKKIETAKTQGKVETSNIYPESLNVDPESAHIISQEEITEEEAEKIKKYNSSWQATLSFIASIVIALVWFGSLIATGGETNEGRGGSAWWIVIAFYFTIGLPLTVVSLVFGAAGLKTKNKNMARFSIFFTILTPIVVFAIIAVRSFLTY